MNSTNNLSSSSDQKIKRCSKCKQVADHPLLKVRGKVFEELKRKNPNVPVEKIKFCRPCAVIIHRDLKEQRSAEETAVPTISSQSTSSQRSLNENSQKRRNDEDIAARQPSKKNKNLNAGLLSQSIESQEVDPVVFIAPENVLEIASQPILSQSSVPIQQISNVSSSTDSLTLPSSQRSVEIAPSQRSESEYSFASIQIHEPIEDEEIEEIAAEPSEIEVEPEPEIICPQIRVSGSSSLSEANSFVYVAPTPVRRPRPAPEDMPVYRHLNGG